MDSVAFEITQKMAEARRNNSNDFSFMDDGKIVVVHVIDHREEAVDSDSL